MFTFATMNGKNETIITLRLSNPGNKTALEQLAEKKKWSVNKYLNELIDKHVKKVKK